MVRTSIKAGLAGFALLTSSLAFAAPATSTAGNDVDSLTRAVAADQARVQSLENELVSIEEELASAKDAKPADPEAVACVKEARDSAKAGLTAAKKKLASDRDALEKAERARDRGSRLAAGGI